MSSASPIWRNGFRYVLLILGFLCLTSICSNYIIINFTFICMARDDSEKVDVGNGTAWKAFILLLCSKRRLFDRQPTSPMIHIA
ncbi:hypothetical protein Y032_0133g1744 [Ancylostoma ceylanicum]|uniref:Uncharacterized protein n=1 Tax=Ancylostoma ceylanicum TaxID=53326 RepID=A0A016T603_9BILA|nr:hypothetical protein Y032_0133g1744 [Ancylostoma ceylanicum]